jgi:hypothetical protein
MNKLNEILKKLNMSFDENVKSNLINMVERDPMEGYLYLRELGYGMHEINVILDYISDLWNYEHSYKKK